MSRATRRSIRSAGVGLTLLVAGAALSGCSGPAPMAFRITDDGVLEIASCNALDGVTSIEIDLQQYVVPWAYDHESQADAEFTFTPAADIPEGSYLSLGGLNGSQPLPSSSSATSGGIGSGSRSSARSLSSMTR